MNPRGRAVRGRRRRSAVSPPWSEASSNDPTGDRRGRVAKSRESIGQPSGGYGSTTSRSRSSLPADVISNWSWTPMILASSGIPAVLKRRSPTDTSMRRGSPERATTTSPFVVDLTGVTTPADSSLQAWPSDAKPLTGKTRVTTRCSCCVGPDWARADPATVDARAAATMRAESWPARPFTPVRAKRMRSATNGNSETKP